MFPWLLHASFLPQYWSSERLMANGWKSKTQVEFIPGFLPITSRVKPHWASYRSHKSARCYRKNSCKQFWQSQSFPPAPLGSLFFTCTRTIPPARTANIVLNGTLTGVNKESTNISMCASDDRVCHFVSIINAAQFSLVVHEYSTFICILEEPSSSVFMTLVFEGKKWAACRSVSVWTQLT